MLYKITTHTNIWTLSCWVDQWNCSGLKIIFFYIQKVRFRIFFRFFFIFSNLWKVNFIHKYFHQMSENDLQSIILTINVFRVCKENSHIWRAINFFFIKLYAHTKWFHLLRGNSFYFKLHIDIDEPTLDK